MGLLMYVDDNYHTKGSRVGVVSGPICFDYVVVSMFYIIW